MRKMSVLAQLRQSTTGGLEKYRASVLLAMTDSNHRDVMLVVSMFEAE
jgi:hypothetical protein